MSSESQSHSHVESLGTGPGHSPSDHAVEVPLQDTPPEYEALGPPQDEVVVMSLHKRNTVRFTDIDEPLAQALCAAAIRAWPQGIVESHWDGGVDSIPKYFKLKLHNYPWRGGQGDESSIRSRALMCALLRTLLEFGWRVEGVGDCCRSRWGSISSLVFMRTDPSVVKAGDMFAIGFNAVDRMWLVDGPEPVAGILLNTVVESWGQGLKWTGQCYGATEYHLRGLPWVGAVITIGAQPTMQDIAARSVMAKELYRLKRLGFSLYATIDVSFDQEAPTWIMLRSD